MKDSAAPQEAPAAESPPVEPTQRLLEQLLDIARLSALEEMASGIAHELNQPLGAIATFSHAGERMLDRPKPMLKETIGVLQNIGNEAMNAGEGIRRIRRLFNVSGPVKVACLMPELIEELQPVLELLTTRCNARIIVSAAPALPSVMVDRLRIQHVLFTLVQNALDATKQSAAQSPLVRIECTSDQYAIETAVIDNGAGISEESQQQLFRPFFTTKPNGTGLGLASSRAIIEAHEGIIGCDNIQAGGARFWFRLPVLNAIKQSEL